MHPTMKAKSTKEKNDVIETSEVKENNQNFKNSMNIVFGHEGGYSNDPDDFGGKQIGYYTINI